MSKIFLSLKKESTPPTPLKKNSTFSWYRKVNWCKWQDLRTIWGTLAVPGLKVTLIYKSADLYILGGQWYHQVSKFWVFEFVRRWKLLLVVIIYTHFPKIFKALRIRRDIIISGSKKMTGFGVSILALVGNFLTLESNFCLPGLPLHSKDNNNTGLF